MSHTITFQGGPADGRVHDVKPYDMGRYVVIPVMMPRAIGAKDGEMWFTRSFEYHRYSPKDGTYLGIEPPHDFPAPFPTIELFYWWATVKFYARTWWPQVNIDRSRTERKLTVSVSIPAANGRR